MVLSKLENSLFFLVLVFLPTQLGKHFWPPFSAVYSLPIDYLAPVIYFWDLLVILLILVFCASKPNVSRAALLVFLIFIFMQLLSLVPFLRDSAPLNIGAGLVRIEQHFIAGLFGVYIASRPFYEILPKLYWPLWIAVVGESILGISQFVLNKTLGLWVLGERTFTISTPAIAKFDFYGQQFLRPYATFPHPNVLAAFITLSIPTLFIATKNVIARQETKIRGNFSDLLENGYLSELSYSYARRMILNIPLLLATVTLLLTVSRISLIGFFVSSFLLLNKRGLILISSCFLLLGPLLYVRYASLFNFDALSSVRREELSAIAWNIFFENPMLGVGVNNFIGFAADTLLVGPSRFLQPIHNIFLLSLAETGIIGFTGMIVFMGFPIYSLFIKGIDTKFGSTLLLIWFLIIFLGMFDHYFLTLPQGYRMLFLFWGLSFSYISSKM